MAFLSINRGRYSYLLSFGTQEGELKKFFADCHRQLLMKGAKVQNLPHGRAARIKAIVERLPSTTDPVVQTWFNKNVTMLDPVPASELVEEFALYESVDDQIPSDQATRLARSCLIHLFDPNPPLELVKFLRTSVGGAEAELPISTEVIPDQVDVIEEEPTSIGALAELLAAAFTEDDYAELLDQLPSPLAVYAEGLGSVRKGDLKAAQESADALPVDSKEHQFLLRAIKRARARPRRGVGVAGVEICAPANYSGEFEAGLESVVAYCTNDRPNATFVHPIGTARGSMLELFSEAQRLRFFPETGDVIAFTGVGRPRQPSRGEIGVWTVAEHATDKRTRFHTVDEVAVVYELVRVPFHSSDADSVRQYIQNTSSDRKSAPLQRQLFALIDGSIIGPKSDKQDLSRTDSYEMAFHLWSRLDAFLFEGRILVLGPLPEATGAYDLAPLATTVKQLMKSIKEQGTNKLTKAQVKEVVETFRTDEAGLTRQRLARIIDRIDIAVSDELALSEMLEVLLKHPSVEERIEAGVQERIHARTAEKDLVSAEIERLGQERRGLEQKIRQLTESHKKISSETSNVVKSAFDKAVNSGVEELARVEVISALAGRLHGELAQPTTSRVSSDASLSAYLLPPLSHEEALTALRGFGIDRRFATALLKAITLASSCGLLILITGTFARQVAKTLAAASGSVAKVIDVSIGIISPLEAVAECANDQSLDVLLLSDANVSDIDLYGRELVDKLLAKVRCGESLPMPILLASLSNGLMALPIPEALKRVSISVDADWTLDFQAGREDEATQRLLSGEVPEDIGMFRPALTRLCEKLAELDGEHGGSIAVLINEALKARK